jgi:hypothetical protein
MPSLVRHDCKKGRVGQKHRVGRKPHRVAIGCGVMTAGVPGPIVDHKAGLAWLLELELLEAQADILPNGLEDELNLFGISVGR